MKFVVKNLEFQNQKTGFNNVAVLEKEEKENHSKRQREQTRDQKMANKNWKQWWHSYLKMGFLAVSKVETHPPQQQKTQQKLRLFVLFYHLARVKNA